MVDKMAYPTLSLSPLMESVELLLILGCNIVSLKIQKENWISKDPSSSFMSPNHPIQSEWYIITMWYPNQKNVEFYVKIWMVPMVSPVDTTQFYQQLF